MDAFPPERNTRNASIIIITKRLSFIEGKNLKLITGLLKYSDSIVLNYSGDIIILGLYIYDVWSRI